MNNNNMPYSDWISEIDNQVDNLKDFVDTVKRIYELYRKEIEKNVDLKKENDILRSLLKVEK